MCVKRILYGKCKQISDIFIWLLQIEGYIQQRIVINSKPDIFIEVFMLMLLAICFEAL